MKVSLVVAAARNGVIGRNNRLPWKLSSDLKFFKKLTTGHAVIMGRKTFESIGKPLPDRTNLVLSRSESFHVPGVMVFRNLDEAIIACRNAGESEAFVIGGAEIFKQTLEIADRIYFTRVEAEVEGDVFFPPLNTGDWEEISCERQEADDRNQYAFTLSVFQRRQ
jgi:dihydrofolate reductase